jgi:uncharacterized protein YndB with AHSA1/START domain
VTDVETKVIEQTIRIAAAPEIVWQHWVDSERVTAWFGPAALDPRPGGEFRIEMEHGPVMLGEFVELVPHERVVFTFGWQGNAPDQVGPGSTRVEITLVPDGDGTVLTLRHTEMPVTHAADHAQGWARCLPILAERAEAGAG